MNCPLKEMCWRYQYSRYLQDGNKYDGKPPERMTLALQGYANSKIMTPKSTGKPGGIYCETFPQQDRKNTWCPDMQSQDFNQCHEYKKETKRQQNDKKKKESYLKRFPNSIKFSKIDFTTRQEISLKSKYKCVYCDLHNSFIKSIGYRMSVDHIVPRALGGGDGKENLALACSRCNSKKGAKIWDFGCMIGKYND